MDRFLKLSEIDPLEKSIEALQEQVKEINDYTILDGNGITENNTTILDGNGN